MILVTRAKRFFSRPPPIALAGSHPYSSQGKSVVALISGSAAPDPLRHRGVGRVVECSVYGVL